MVGGEDAARHAVGNDRDPGRICEGARRRIGAVCPDVAAEHEHGPLGCAQQRGDAREITLHGRGCRRCVERSGRRRSEEDVHGHIDERRSAVS